MLDHGTGLVIGETAVVGNKVSLMQASAHFLFSCVVLSASMMNFIHQGNFLNYLVIRKSLIVKFIRLNTYG